MNSLEYLESLSPVSGYQQESLPVAMSSALLKRCDWAEFGTSKGFSTKCIYEYLPKKVNLHLFDWFKGLPEDWHCNGKIVKKGANEGRLPEWMFETFNIKIHEGLFKDTIPIFAELQKRKLGFINIDCDLYSSTKTIFENIDHLIVPGTVIHFDEFYNFDSWAEHEFRAFIEWAINYDRNFKYIARTNHCQVVVKIIR